jgi:hypothetical protein
VTKLARKGGNVLQIITDEDKRKSAEGHFLQVLRYAAPSVSKLLIRDYAYLYEHKVGPHSAQRAKSCAVQAMRCLFLHFPEKGFPCTKAC